MVQPEQFRILYDFDARAPWVFHESELEKSGHLADRRDDPDARRFEFLRLRVDVREGEANVIDGASGARFRVRFLEEKEPRAAEHDAVRTLRVRATAEVFLIPGGGLRGIGHVQMDVVVGKCLRGTEAGKSPQGKARESSRKQDLSHRNLSFTPEPGSSLSQPRAATPSSNQAIR